MIDKQNSQSGWKYSGKHADLLQPATVRPLVRHDEEIRAAKMIADPTCYSDFYVDKGDGSTFPFRGALGHSISWAQFNDKKKVRRMARVDRMGLSAVHQRLWGAGCADHFDESQHNGGWDEIFYETREGGVGYEGGPSFVEQILPQVFPIGHRSWSSCSKDDVGNSGIPSAAGTRSIWEVNGLHKGQNSISSRLCTHETCRLTVSHLPEPKREVGLQANARGISNLRLCPSSAQDPK